MKARKVLITKDIIIIIPLHQYLQCNSTNLHHHHQLHSTYQKNDQEKQKNLMISSNTLMQDKNVSTNNSLTSLSHQFESDSDKSIQNINQVILKPLQRIS